MQNESVEPKSPSWVRTVIVGRNPRLTLVRLAVLVAAIILLRAYVFLPIRVDGPSMLPTYSDGGVNIVNQLAYRNQDPKRFDVVAIRFTGHSLMLMKRIIAMPGETIEFVNGQTLINGQPLDEPYVKNSWNWDHKPDNWKLGDDEYYVVGDNRSMPFEDHKQGVARRERIVGRVML